MFLASGLMAAPFLLMQRLPRDGWPQAVRLRCFLQEMKGTRRMALLVLLGWCLRHRGAVRCSIAVQSAAHVVYSMVSP